ncbi:MAG: methionine ABC transporter ATP-binding protein [Miniphocaeibacter sp.]|jgi:D-methionine transport system ATP-binding protein|uniref:methionine ABC transporter ATP-binding protein n=1 Tax=Miniphocaeibacter sp. TaxID=3100973 RepID=UPI001839A50B|nr:methionine ABC transporter ATP-binding protein [Gallicola sp.]
MIKIEKLKKHYGELKVLENINLKIDRGKIYGIAGRSGAGKSTLLRCINKLENYDSGSIKIDGVEVELLSDEEIRLLRKEIGMIFQNFPLISRATVYENVALPMTLWKCDKKYIEKRVKKLLELVQIPEKCNNKARELSGGQKQRVSIARALAMEPKILLSDESTSALDPSSTDSIVSLLKDINEELNITIVVVSHEMDVMQNLCDEMAIIENGVIKTLGKVEDVFIEKSPALLRLLGNENIREFAEEKNVLEIFYDIEGTNATLFSEMAKDINVDFKLLRNESMNLKNSKLDTALISVSNNELEKIKEYLVKREVRYRQY